MVKEYQMRFVDCVIRIRSIGRDTQRICFPAQIYRRPRKARNTVTTCDGVTCASHPRDESACKAKTFHKSAPKAKTVQRTDKIFMTQRTDTPDRMVTAAERGSVLRDMASEALAPFVPEPLEAARLRDAVVSPTCRMELQMQQPCP